MIRPPVKNFGILPTGELVAHCFVFVLFGVLPLIMFLVQFVTGVPLKETATLRVVVGVIIVGRYAWTVFSTPGGLRTIWEVSKRRRYIHKSLNRHFKEKYGLKVVNVDAVLTGDNLTLKGRRNPPEDAFMLGWEYVEAAATGEGLDSPLAETIFLVQPSVNGKAMELPLRQGAEEDRATFSSHENLPAVPTLGETETGIKTMISGIIQSLPSGHATLRCIAPDGSEIGVESEMTVEVETDSRLSYSLKEFQTLVESVLFNVRLADATMVVCIVEKATGKKYICGHIVQNTGYSDVPVETLKTITDEDDFKEFIFVKNAKEMH